MPRDNDPLPVIFGLLLAGLLAGAALGVGIYASVRYAVDAAYAPILIQRCASPHCVFGNVREGGTLYLGSPEPQAKP